MNKDIEQVQYKAKQLAIPSSEIKKAIKLFEYAKLFKVEFYIDSKEELRMRKIQTPFTKEDKEKLDKTVGGKNKSAYDTGNIKDLFGKDFGGIFK